MKKNIQNNFPYNIIYFLLSYIFMHSPSYEKPRRQLLLEEKKPRALQPRVSRVQASVKTSYYNFQIYLDV